MLDIDLKKMSEEQRSNLAIITSDTEVLEVLASDVNSHVRRMVAKNKHVTREILEVLVDDPVLNVSYIASQNHNISTQKDFFSYMEHPCISCNNFEKNFTCNFCKKLELYSGVLSAG